MLSVRCAIVGLLLSQVFRKRWLSLTGLAMCFAAIGIGTLTKNGVLVASMAFLGVVLMFVGMVVSVYKNVKATRAGQPPGY